MSEKISKTLQIPFKDKDFPTNKLSVERTLEIEAKVMPELMAQLDKLREENPELFKEPRNK